MTSKSDNLRYSIIPARAITDPAITAQALRVLALLGRHADNNGWCCRSQVKMAQELGCSRGTIQNALDLLIGPVNGAGYVERREENRAGVRPEEGRHPHCSYSYRVRLDLDDDRREGVARANRLARQVPTEQHEVPTQEKHGVPASLAPLTEHTPKKRSPEEHTRAREVSTSGFDRFWTELRNHWPDYEARNWPANKRATENAWRVLDLAGELRPPGEMVAAARVEGRKREAAAQAVKRPGDRPPHGKSPSAWLLERCFAGILDELTAPPPALADKTLDDLAQGARRVIAPEHIEALQAQGIPDAEIVAWFLDAEFIDEPPMVRASTSLKAKEIAKRYPRQVAAVLRVAPEFVTFEWRRERAA